METLDFLTENVKDILLLVEGLFATAWTVARLTPNKWDDSVLAKLQRLFDVYRGQ